MAKPQIEPRILKGFRDYLPESAIPRRKMVSEVEQVFQTYGFSPIETPALEYTDILLGKGSTETDKQLYRFLDNGERDVALRFDLTVPLARFAAMHIQELGTPFKRYHIAPVWRAEKPQRGRYREFIQCDYDILGTKSLNADAEIVAVTHFALKKLGIKHIIRINSRVLLNGVLDSLGLSGKSTSVLRAIDKRDKLGIEVVSQELQNEAGLSSNQISEIFSFLELSANKKDAALVLNAIKEQYKRRDSVLKGVCELEIILSGLSAMQVPESSIKIDLSITRGLDYYTGCVFETLFADLPDIGSICGGGRYDNLVGLYSNRELPGVGAAIGLDRILAGLEEMGTLKSRSATADVLVTVFNEVTFADCAKIAQALREAGITVELYLENDKLGQQFKYASRKAIPIAVIAGPDELKNNAVAVKDLRTGSQTDSIPMKDLAFHIKKLLLTV